MNKIKLLLISNMYPSEEHPFYGIFVKNFVANFEHTNVTVVSSSFIYGRGRSIPEKAWKYLKFYSSVINNIFQFRYDIIYVHYPSYASLPILLCSSFIRKPIILNFHGSDVLSSNKTAVILHKILKPLLKKSNTIVVPSVYFQQVVSSKFSILNEKIFISPSGGLDSNIFKPLKIIKSKNFKIGYVGRIDEGKGWDILLKACDLLKKEIPSFLCDIVGNGSQVDEMKKNIEELNLSQNIQFLGPISHPLLPDLYNNLDIFVFPTIRSAESLGLVGIEALSCGVPVIGSRIGGLQDYIKDDVNGYLFEPGNHEELAAKILFLYKNKSKLKQFKMAARNSVLSYDKKIVVNNLNSKLEEIFLAENQ